ncbi:tryptophanase [Syntrophus aciditrophicus]|uniref:Tyrosine phenol-lyase n=1 Tax=Syntrophus aciditrophicus (strain SB) TaxID=56780 RepID=Q2LRX9_SYNAS|nr:tryptophanase [Syntrophus aciditrophicus]ABC76837.1 tyrosine phenol-lyase [Syntrophus aciditrophicus SB]OPY17776.1 MAG: Tyrosine phenol-lyase [Syntrophus sp. PtaB.Bin075]
MNIRLSNGKLLPVEMHKIKIVQQTRLPSADERLRAMEEAGYNTFLLRTRDVFLDMLTDSGTNAMSDNQLGAMMVADDAYAGSESFYKLQDAVNEVFGLPYLLPAHQGRAAEHLLAKVLVKPGDVVPMNYHFTTTKAHFTLAGGTVLEIFTDEALNTDSKEFFKGNIDTDKFLDVIKTYGSERISFVRMEATTNLLGGQPFSMANYKKVKEIAAANNIKLVLDASLISEQAYFIKQREDGYKDRSIAEIIWELADIADIVYLSGRKSCAVRGGFIATKRKDIFDTILPWLPVYEGFATYGGMSTKEIEAMAVGIREMTQYSVASSSADMIQYFAEQLKTRGIPVVTPPGGLACHIDARRFLPDIPPSKYIAASLTSAVYLISGARGMERGTMSEQRDPDGNEVFSDLELLRLAVPRRTYTLAQIDYVVDRVAWLANHRDLIKGLIFYEEPPILRFFFGKMRAIDNWGAKLVEAFKNDFGPEL